MIAELQEMMQAQFTAGTVDISRFEARIMGGAINYAPTCTTWQVITRT
jgi:hypothetical protein